MNNLGIHEETPLDRAIVRQDEALQKQANECGNRLYAMVMELIEERCQLKLEVARLKYELEAMRICKEHDEC